MAKGEWSTYLCNSNDTEIYIHYDNGDTLELYLCGELHGDRLRNWYEVNGYNRIVMDMEWVQRCFKDKPVPHSGPIAPLPPLKGTRPTGAQNDAFWVEVKKPEADSFEIRIPAPRPAPAPRAESFRPGDIIVLICLASLLIMAGALCMIALLVGDGR